MRRSTIAKHARTGPGSAFAIALGATIRTERRRAGLSQRQLAHPASGSFISSVEAGRICPSMGSLLLIAERLDRPLPNLLTDVNERMTVG